VPSRAGGGDEGGLVAVVAEGLAAAQLAGAALGLGGDRAVPEDRYLVPLEGFGRAVVGGEGELPARVTSDVEDQAGALVVHAGDAHAQALAERGVFDGELARALEVGGGLGVGELEDVDLPELGDAGAAGGRQAAGAGDVADAEAAQEGGVAGLGLVDEVVAGGEALLVARGVGGHRRVHEPVEVAVGAEADAVVGVAGVPGGAGPGEEGGVVGGEAGLPGMRSSWISPTWPRCIRVRVSSSCQAARARARARGTRASGRRMALRTCRFDHVRRARWRGRRGRRRRGGRSRAWRR
jgi:hypothetical protein